MELDTKAAKAANQRTVCIMMSCPVHFLDILKCGSDDIVIVGQFAVDFINSIHGLWPDDDKAAINPSTAVVNDGYIAASIDPDCKLSGNLGHAVGRTFSYRKGSYILPEGSIIKYLLTGEY